MRTQNVVARGERQRRATHRRVRRSALALPSATSESAAQTARRAGIKRAPAALVMRTQRRRTRRTRASGAARTRAGVEARAGVARSGLPCAPRTSSRAESGSAEARAAAGESEATKKGRKDQSMESCRYIQESGEYVWKGRPWCCVAPRISTASVSRLPAFLWRRGSRSAGSPCPMNPAQ